MKIGERSLTIKKLDKEFSRFIRNRDKRCVLCGKTENLQCGHLFSRVAHSTRWSEVNCHGQCSGCNVYHEHNPHKFTIWFINKFGVDKYKLLFFQHNQTRKYTTGELQGMLLYYKQQNGCQ